MKINKEEELKALKMLAIGLSGYWLVQIACFFTIGFKNGSFFLWLTLTVIWHVIFLLINYYRYRREIWGVTYLNLCPRYGEQKHRCPACGWVRAVPSIDLAVKKYFSDLLKRL